MELLTMSQALERYRQIHLETPKFGMNVLSDDFSPHDIVILQSNSQRKEGVPVRCDFYTMVFCLEGGSIRYVNQFEYTINAHSLHLLPPGSIHSFKDTFDTTRYYVILFEKDFSEERALLDFHGEHLESVNLAPPLFHKIKDIFEEIETELKSGREDNCLYAKYLLNELLLILKREKLKIKGDTPKTRADIICSRFLGLLEENFKTMKGVGDYAALLHLTPKYLSETVKARLGKSALHYIHKRIVKEAEYLLVYTDKTVYSIALALNFPDASQFTKFFKQKVGKSPKQYRIDNSD
jgi:AraC family transcriptional regulator, transcriptional activator of pobA